jgi:hypothetical protein
VTGAPVVGDPAAPTPRRRLPARATDTGSVTLLSIAFGALALLLLTAVVSATGVHLEQKRLLSLADELALEAADAVDLAAFYRGEAPPPTADGVVPLTDADVRRAVDEYLAAHLAVVADLEGLQVVDAGSDDGRTARVTLAAEELVTTRISLNSTFQSFDIRVVAVESQATSQ